MSIAIAQRRFPSGAGPLSFVVLLALSSGPAHPESSCWVDLYDQPNCEGTHVRVSGPAELISIRNLQGSDWANRIESLKTGPGTRFIGYREENFDTSHGAPSAHPDAFKSWGNTQLPVYLGLEIDIGPNKTESHLAELNFHRKIQSLKVICDR